MLVTPEIETRTEQPYVAIRAQVSMAGIAAFAVRTREVFDWLGARGRRWRSRRPGPSGRAGHAGAGARDRS